MLYLYPVTRLLTASIILVAIQSIHNNSTKLKLSTRNSLFIYFQGTFQCSALTDNWSKVNANFTVEYSKSSNKINKSRLQGSIVSNPLHLIHILTTYM